MKIINPKCTNENSFKYSILILLHYYDFNKNRERINQLNKYIKNYKFEDTILLLKEIIQIFHLLFMMKIII